MSDRTEDIIYEEIMELGPRSSAHKIYELERENNQLRADFEKCVEALNEAKEMLDIMNYLPFAPQNAQEGSPKDLIDKALSTPSAQAILKQNQ